MDQFDVILRIHLMKKWKKIWH